MTSTEELKAVRLFRALNTMVQLCHDRGYVVRHPSVVAEAVRDPELYDREEGLDYDWFLRHFVLKPDSARGPSPSHHPASDTAAAATLHGSPTRKRSKEMKEEWADDDGDRGTGGSVEESEAFQRAANGEWVCLRNAMRLTCLIDPSRTTETPFKREQSGGPSMSAVKMEPEEDEEAGTSHALANARRAAAAVGEEEDKSAKRALMVFFSGASKLTVKEVQAFREKALKKKAAAMIIVANKVEPSVRADVQELSGRMNELTGAELLSIQVFEEEALAFNVVHHETVPHHVALTPTEAEAFLAEHKLSLAQLPRILESDPLVQYLGLPRGSIVRITRDSKQSGPYSMYRHVM